MLPSESLQLASLRPKESSQGLEERFSSTDASVVSLVVGRARAMVAMARRTRGEKCMIFDEEVWEIEAKYDTTKVEKDLKLRWAYTETFAVVISSSERIKIESKTKGWTKPVVLVKGAKGIKLYNKDKNRASLGTQPFKSGKSSNNKGPALHERTFSTERIAPLFAFRTHAQC